MWQRHSQVLDSYLCKHVKMDYEYRILRKTPPQLLLLLKWSFFEKTDFFSLQCTEYQKKASSMLTRAMLTRASSEWLPNREGKGEAPDGTGREGGREPEQPLELLFGKACIVLTQHAVLIFKENTPKSSLNKCK